MEEGINAPQQRFPFSAYLIVLARFTPYLIPNIPIFYETKALILSLWSNSSHYYCLHILQYRIQNFLALGYSSSLKMQNNILILLSNVRFYFLNITIQFHVYSITQSLVFFWKFKNVPFFFSNITLTFTNTQKIMNLEIMPKIPSW